MRYGQRAALLVFAVAAPVLAQAAEDPGLWLLRMSEAAHSANYEGSVFYSGDQVTESFRVTHRNQGGVERERVQSLSGEPREVEKQGDNICAVNNSKRVNRPTPKGLFPGLSRERLQQVSQVYKFADLGEDRVAGRTCRGIAITPRDDYRYGYQVWADAQTGVPLKMELRARDRVIERMEFVEVSFPADIPDTAFGPAAPGATETASAAPPAAATPASVPPELTARFGGKLPEGFRVALREVRTVPGKGTVEHWLLTDGLSAISVFSTTQRASGAAKGFTGPARIGAVSAYGRMSGQVHITVVGEVPQQTVQMVGDGLKPAEAPPKH